MRFTRNRTAAVLGCGPAGMFAAHALVENGWSVRVFSKARKSHMYGAQYLHAPIDGLSPIDEEPERIRYVLRGEASGYREKVYGSLPIKVSPEALTMEHDAWDIRAAYDMAWEMYSEGVEDTLITPDWIASGALDSFHTVVSSIPLPELCTATDSHEFHAARIWAYGDAPRRGQYAPYRPPEQTVICDGTRDTGWYRASNVHGHVTMEWPYAKKPPLPGIAEVVKPLWHTCDCHTNHRWRFVKVGRYGAWSKGVLSHQAYTTASAL